MQQSFRQAVLGIAQNRVQMLSLSGELLPFMRQCNARLFSVSCFEVGTQNGYSAENHFFVNARFTGLCILSFELVYSKSFL